MNCKFTDSDNTTYNDTIWVPGKWRKTDGSGELCGPGWLHYYEHPLLAELHNPIHGKYDTGAKLWEIQVGRKILRDDQMKAGATRIRLIREIGRPDITIVQRLAYGILCAKAVYRDRTWNNWADKWLSGEDRSGNAANDGYVNADVSPAWKAADAVCMAEERVISQALYRIAAAADDAAVTHPDIDLLTIAKRAMEVV